ncbi:MAG: hypothetical protein R3F49_15870 [Planctomycetota bacterium]
MVEDRVTGGVGARDAGEARDDGVDAPHAVAVDHARGQLARDGAADGQQECFGRQASTSTPRLGLVEAAWT